MKREQHQEESLETLIVCKDPREQLEVKNIAKGMEAEKVVWVSELIKAGIKLAHPNDGWVNRSSPQWILSPCYPYFDESPKAGDMVALGCPWEASFLLFRVIEISYDWKKTRRLTEPGYILERLSEVVFTAPLKLPTAGCC